MADNNKEETEFGVILESIDSNVKHIVEAVDSHTNQLNRLEDRVENLEPMKDDVVVIKTTLAAANLPALHQKVIDLGQRIINLEAKLVS